MDADSTILSTGLLMGISTVFVALRIVVGILQCGKTATFCTTASKVSTAALVLGWMCMIFSGSIVIYCIQTSPAKVDIDGVSWEHLPGIIKLPVAVCFGYLSAMWIVKLSFVAMYFNLKQGLQRHFEYALYGTAAYIVIAFVILLCCKALLCAPLSLGGMANPEACTPATNHIVISLELAFTITSDLTVILLPILILRTMKIGTADIYAVIFLLLLGAATVTAAVIRYVIIFGISNAVIVTSGAINMAHFLAGVEITTCIIAAACPSLRAQCRVWHKRRTNKNKTVENVEFNKAGRGLQAMGANLGSGGESSCTIYEISSGRGGGCSHSYFEAV